MFGNEWKFALARGLKVYFKQEGGGGKPPGGFSHREVKYLKNTLAQEVAKSLQSWRIATKEAPQTVGCTCFPKVPRRRKKKKKRFVKKKKFFPFPPKRPFFFSSPWIFLEKVKALFPNFEKNANQQAFLITKRFFGGVGEPLFVWVK